MKQISPIIISASRSTDIPAFFTEWFFARLAEGFVLWRNPFNNTFIKVILDKVRLIVFWSKNPEPLVQHLTRLDEKGIGYYFQYTLNDYQVEGFEPGVPSLEKRIETFKLLSSIAGRQKVIWRFDPLILSPYADIDSLLERVEYIGSSIISYTDKLVISFADILDYKKVSSNLIRFSKSYNAENIAQAEFSYEQKIEFAEKLYGIYNKWKKINTEFTVSTCAEEIALEAFGITHNKCIDDLLIAKLFNHDRALMDYLGYDNKGNKIIKLNLKDKGQRRHCNCIKSKDIGVYNTCLHNCLYCYANDYSRLNGFLT
jgi:DNA repair photolyase